MDNTSTVTENRFSKVFGAPKERTVAKVKDSMSQVVMDFIARSPFLVMATSDRSGNCDASPKGGKPGFVRVLHGKRLVIPDVAGNKLFQSYLNMNDNPQVGLVFLIHGCNDTVRVNGRVSILTASELEGLNIKLSISNPDDNSIQLQGILVEVDESYTHCPRALKFAELWDIENIKGWQTSNNRRAA